MRRPAARRGTAMTATAAIAIPVITAAVAALLFLAGCGLVNPNGTPAANLPPSNTNPTAAAEPSLIISIHMMNPQSGWALTETAVLRTTDGGVHWADVTPRAESGAKPGLGAFLDENTAWVIFSKDQDKVLTIFRTVDGGNSWSSAQLTSSDPNGSPYATSLQFVDPGHGWILVSYGVAAGSEAVELYQSADGGATWSLAAAGMPSTLSGSLPFGGGKSGISFYNAENGWLTGSDAGNSIYLFATRDGGKTWQRQALAAPTGYSTEGGSVATRPPIFFGSKDGFLPVIFHQPGQPTIFYVTHDGGASWHATAPVTSATNNAFMWSFVDAAHGFATDGSALYATGDGARTWKAVTTNIALDGVTQLDFVSPTTGFAIVDGNVVETGDGGHTWSPVTTQFVLRTLPENFEPSAIAFWNADHGVVAGTAGFASRYLGLLAVTSDGGQSWQVVEQGGAGFWGVAVSGSTTGWAIKSSRCAFEGGSDCVLTLLRTDDGGRTWKSLRRGIAYVSFASTDLGWGLQGSPAEPGRPDVIFTTHDGGEYWETMPAPCSGYTWEAGAVSLVSATDAWVACVGEPGAGQQMKSLFRTTDGGKTWTPAGNLGGGGYLDGMFFLPDGHGWLWMSRGPLLATVDGGATWSEINFVQPEVVEAHSVWFASDQVGFVLLRDNNQRSWRLVKTTDGGQKWTTVQDWPIH